MSCCIKNQYKINDKLYIYFLKGKTYVFYMGNIVVAIDFTNKINDIEGLIKKTKPSIKTTYGYYTPIGVIK